MSDGLEPSGIASLVNKKPGDMSRTKQVMLSVLLLVLFTVTTSGVKWLFFGGNDADTGPSAQNENTPTFNNNQTFNFPSVESKQSEVTPVKPRATINGPASIKQNEEFLLNGTLEGIAENQYVWLTEEADGDLWPAIMIGRHMSNWELPFKEHGTKVGDWYRVAVIVVDEEGNKLIESWRARNESLDEQNGQSQWPSIMADTINADVIASVPIKVTE